MEDVGSKYKDEKSIYETPRATASKERNDAGYRGSRESVLSMPVQENRPLTEQPVGTQHITKKPEKNKMDSAVHTPVRKPEPVQKKEPGEHTVYTEHEKAYEGKKSMETKTDSDGATKIIMKNKTMSVTIKGKAESRITAKRTTRQPVKTAPVKTQNPAPRPGAVPHPTSSMPQ
jgi:N-acetylmuramoyl-L-alanine amidase CwlA